jgi:UV DNA damage endonuclease
MKIGYPCVNWTIGCSSGSTFRLRSYSENRLKETIKINLDCLLRILEFNVEHDIFFFRITSDLIPFASHPINTFNWKNFFASSFEEIGDFIKKKRIRISMHPDQFTLINSVREDVFERSLKELEYHACVLDLMLLDTSAKIQIHVGGVYDNKQHSTDRFVERFSKLDNCICRRLVVENDDRSYNLNDCIEISNNVGVPVLFDVFHHSINGTGASINQAIQLSSRTWNQKRDGILMVDYSSLNMNGPSRQHADSIDIKDFKRFLVDSAPFDFDVMLEIKDKEKSAAKAVEIAKQDVRTEVLHNVKYSELKDLNTLK